MAAAGLDQRVSIIAELFNPAMMFLTAICPRPARFAEIEGRRRQPVSLRSGALPIGVVLALSTAAPCAAGQPAAKAILPPDDAWTERLDFPVSETRRGWGWTFRHEDRNKALCKPVHGESILLDKESKTTGHASIRFRYKSSEARLIRTDTPATAPRQLYNVLRLPSPPVDASGYDAIELDLRCEPDGAVTAVRILVNQRLADNQNTTVTGGNLRFRAGDQWRRFGLYLDRLSNLRRARDKDARPPDWTKCSQIVIDVKISTDALKESEYVEVWVDGLRFVKGKSDAADKLAAALSAPRPAASPFGELPVIDWEDLGVMVRGRTTLRGSPGLGFSTDKDGWSAYAGYRDHIVRRKPWAICEVNLQTGQVKQFLAPPEEQTDAWIFQVFPDGRPYALPGGGRDKGARIARLDWQTGKLQIFGPCPDPWNYCWRWGACDDAIYIGGYRKGYAIRFDPETGKITNYGVQGPPDGIHVLSIAADDVYVYTTVGKNNSYLVACNKETKEQRILRQAEYPKKWSLNSWDGQVFPRLHPPTYKDGVAKWQEFRVRHAKLEPIPERPARQRSTKLRDAFGKPRPELLRGSAYCLGDGYATLWYRWPNKPWQSIRYPVDDVASYLFRLGATRDGKIIGSSEDPYTIFTYDPATGEKQLLGPPPNMTHVYSFLDHPNGKVYMCGYSGAPLFAYDPREPWTYQPSTPDQPTPNWKDPSVNPRQVARMYRQRRAFRVVLAADGRLYIPCSAYVETIPGGGLGWYDPEKDEAGLIREGFETWRGNDACTARDGRYVVVTTVPWPQDQGNTEVALTDPHDLVSTQDGLKIRYRTPEGATGKRITPEAEVARLVAGRKNRTVAFDQTNYVVTFDTKTRRVIGRLPMGEGSTAGGVVCEWEPGQVIYCVTSARDGKYGVLDVTRQTIDLRLHIPGLPKGKLLRLPDGRIGSIQSGAIILIDPSDWTWEAVGMLRPITDGRALAPRDWVVLGDDLYLYCDTQLGRIRNVAALGRP